jgi:hypothetical protein
LVTSSDASPTPSPPPATPYMTTKRYTITETIY